MESLKLLSNGIQGTASRDVIAEVIASFVSLQENASERQLLESLPDCLACLEGVEYADRNDIRLVLEKITRGQMLDLQRFDNPQEIRSLSTAADLEEYTYLVAGCVGEFWTRLCFRHVRQFASRSEDEMLALGKRYGMALQLINVLRDAGSRSSSGQMLFSRPRIKLGASDSLADPLRIGALPADLSKVAGESKGRPCVWNGIFARNRKSSRARCDGAAGFNRRAHTRAFGGIRSRGLAADRKGRAQRGARDGFVTGIDHGIAPENGCDIRPGQTVAVALLSNAFTTALRTRLRAASAWEAAKPLQEIISLSLADGSLEPLEDLEHVFPDFAFFGRRLVSQQVCGVIRDHQWNAVVSMPAATQFAHGCSRSE